MNDSKEEETPCNSVQSHRKQLLNHQQDIDRDLEAGCCPRDEDDEETREEAAEGEEGEEGEGDGQPAPPPKPKQVIPPLYNVEPGCTALGCYSAIATGIVLMIGIICMLMYFSPPDAWAPNLPFPLIKKSDDNSTADPSPLPAEPQHDTN